MRLCRRQQRYRDWLREQRGRYDLRGDEVSDDEVIRAIKSVPRHFALSLVTAVSHSRQSGTSSPSLTVTSTTAGSLLVCAMSGRAGLGAATVNSFTDNKSQTWVQATAARATDSSQNGFCDVWYFPNSASGVTSVTATYSASQSDIYMSFWEIGGAATSSPQDGNGAVVTNGTDVPVDCAKLVLCTTGSRYTFSA